MKKKYLVVDPKKTTWGERFTVIFSTLFGKQWHFSLEDGTTVEERCLEITSKI